MPSYTAGKEAARSNQTALMEMTLYIYTNAPLESGRWTAPGDPSTCVLAALLSSSHVKICIHPFDFPPHGVFFKFSPLGASGTWLCSLYRPGCFLQQLLFDADSRWQRQSWQILAEMVGELNGTNSLISPYPVPSWLETWKRRKSGRMRKNGAGLLPFTFLCSSSPTALAGKYVTPLTSSGSVLNPHQYGTTKFFRGFSRFPGCTT